MLLETPILFYSLAGNNSVVESISGAEGAPDAITRSSKSATVTDVYIEKFKKIFSQYTVVT